MSKRRGFTLIEQLFADPPMPNDNQAVTQLREVEVERHGNVYVLNCHYRNGSDVLWAYDANGQLMDRCELQAIEIAAPIGLCVSTFAPVSGVVGESAGRQPRDGSRAVLTWPELSAGG